MKYICVCVSIHVYYHTQNEQFSIFFELVDFLYVNHKSERFKDVQYDLEENLYFYCFNLFIKCYNVLILGKFHLHLIILHWIECFEISELVICRIERFFADFKGTTVQMPKIIIYTKLSLWKEWKCIKWFKQQWISPLQLPKMICITACWILCFINYSIEFDWSPTMRKIQRFILLI